MKISRSVLTLTAAAVASTLMLAGCGLFVGADEYLARGEKQLADGNYNEAMIELKNAQSKAPHDPRVLLAIARTSLMAGTREATSKALDDAAAAGADRVAVASARAQLLLNANQHAKVLEFLDDPKSPLGPDAKSLFRVQALAGLNRCEEAIPLAREVLAANAESGDAHLAIAGCYARHGNPARALKELASPEDSDSPSGMYVALGGLQSAAGKRDEAVKSWRKAAELAPGELSLMQQAVLLSALADMQFERDDIQGLRQTREKMLRIAPQATMTELLGARLEALDGKSVDAVNHLRAIATQNPELPAVHVLLTSAYIEQRQWEQAVREAAWLDSKLPSGGAPRLGEEIKALSSSKPDTEEFWMLTAAVQNRLGQLQASRASLEKALRLAPASLNPQLALAALEFRMGRIDAAIKAVEPLARQYPADLRVLALSADIYAAAGRFAESSAALDTVLAKTPNAAIAITAHRVRKRGELERPNAPIETYLRDHPHDLEARAVYAEALRLQGDNRAAIAQYEMLVATATKSPVLLNNLAALYQLEGDKRALDTARRASELAPHSPPVLDTYGWLLVESGAVADGLALLSQANASAGLIQPEIRLHYVAALMRHGQKEEARRALAQLLAEKPEFPSESDASRLLASLSGLSAT